MDKNFTLAFIPARGGSKELKNKNILNLNKKPLIKYTLDLIKSTKPKLQISDYMVSTDSAKILKLLKKFKIKNNYVRPKKFSGDRADIVDTVIHGVNWYEKKNKVKVDNIILLQPTSPIRNLLEVNKAINLFKINKIQSLFSAIKLDQSPYEIFEINDKSIRDNIISRWNYLKMPKKKMKRRQDYKKNFIVIDGSFYIVKYNFLKKYKKFICKKNSKVYLNSLKFKIDINTRLDLKLTEALIEKKLI